MITDTQAPPQQEIEVKSKTIEFILNKLHGSVVPGKKDPDMRILVPHYEETAAGYYRMVVPLLEARTQQYFDCIFKDEISTTIDEERALAWSTFIVLGRVADPEVANVFLEMGKYGKKLIIDQDDYPEAVGQTGKAKIINSWNEERLGQNQRVIMGADLVTVSCEFLKEMYGSLRPNKPTIVMPNYIDALNPRWNFKREPRTDGKIVIGWMAGPAHITESEIMSEVVNRVLDKHPNVLFKAVGFLDDWMLDIDRERTILKPGRFPMEKYPSLMSDIDIGLAPLADIEFNWGKSDLKFLEYTAAGVLPVISDIRTYATIPNLVALKAKTCDDFVDIISGVVTSKNNRDAAYGRAMRYVTKHRTAYTNAYKWYNAYKSVLN